MNGMSEKQMEVMKWLGKKWCAQPLYGETWTINGGAHRQGVTCTTRTLTALEKKGLAVKDEDGCWIATESGRALILDAKD